MCWAVKYFNSDLDLFFEVFDILQMVDQYRSDMTLNMTRPKWWWAQVGCVQNYEDIYWTSIILLLILYQAKQMTMLNLIILKLYIE